MIEHCVRCAAPAVSVMSFSYGEAAARLDDITGSVERGSAYPLCEDHAERFTPPVGWTLVDRRERTVRPLFTSREVA